MSVIPKKYKDCYSLESRASHGAEDRDIQKVDEIIIRGNRYIFFQDDHGAYWYKTQIKKGARYIDMEEAIFGKNPPKKYYRHNA